MGLRVELPSASPGASPAAVQRNITIKIGAYVEGGEKGLVLPGNDLRQEALYLVLRLGCMRLGNV